MKVLFICNQNQNRSKTAAQLFSKLETRSAGLYNEYPVKKEDLAWADLIVVMENEQRSELGRRFPDEYLKKKIISLDIPDIYRYNEPELKNLIVQRLMERLPAPKKQESKEIKK